MISEELKQLTDQLLSSKESFFTSDGVPLIIKYYDSVSLAWNLTDASRYFGKVMIIVQRICDDKHTQTSLRSL